MTPLEMIAEWRRGCGNTIGAEPEQCEECTKALIEAIAAKLAEPVAVPQVAGMGRDTSHPRAVVLYLRSEPTDDDIRAIQDVLRAARPHLKGSV